MNAHINQPTLRGSPHETLGQGPVEHTGEEGDDVDPMQVTRLHKFLGAPEEASRQSFSLTRRWFSLRFLMPESAFHAGLAELRKCRCRRKARRPPKSPDTRP